MTEKKIKAHPVIRKNNTAIATFDNPAFNQCGNVCMYCLDVTPNPRGHFTKRKLTFPGEGAKSVNRA
ncbi:hypothetical protein GSB46_003570 [Salmonella enterica]|nr:hypothetical protein [Salmonella enterica]